MIFILQSFEITDDYCGNSDTNLNSWIDGHIPVTGEAAVTFPEKVLTSLTVHQINDYTVLFAGTQDGSLIKVS